MEKAQPILKKLFHYIKLFIRFIRYHAKKSPYLTRSIILHFFLLILISGLIPKCSRDIEKPKVIEVSIIQAEAPVVEKEKPKRAKKQEKPKPKEKKKEPKKATPKPQPKKKEKPKQEQVEAKKAEKKKPKQNAPSLKKEEIKKKPEKKEEPKPEPKKQEKKQVSEKEREGKKSLLKDLEKKELDNIFEDIEKQEDKKKKEEPKPEPEEVKKEIEQPTEFVPDAKFVNEVKSIVQGQITQCWSIPIGAKNVDELTVELYIELDRLGAVKVVKIVDEYKYNKDNSYRALADSAVWAVKECSPLIGLPEDKHKFWKEIQFKFDASSIL